MKKNILAIGAHPDDIEIGCGGILALLAKKSYEITHLIVTSGEEGGLVLSKTKLKKRRELEALNSAKIIGAKKVIFLRAPDGSISSKSLKLDFVRLIRQICPEIIFTHASLDDFADHQIVNQLTMNAVSLAGGPWYPAAGRKPFQVKKVFGYEVWSPIPRPQMSIDITASLQRKIQALACHTSQTGAMGYLAAVRGLAKYRGVMSMVGEFAEVFEVLRGDQLF